MLRPAWRNILHAAAMAAAMFVSDPPLARAEPATVGEEPDQLETARLADLKARWQSYVKGAGLGRYCLSETGEEIGWLISPVLTGYYYAFRATRDRTWVERFVACTDAWLRRAITEPDGYIGWPKVSSTGPAEELDRYYADSLLGEAMALRPVVLMAAEILKDPVLMPAYGGSARRYIDVAKSLFKKWDERGSWRPKGDGLVAVELPYGIEQPAGTWTSNYARRFDPQVGFSLPDNKQNLVACWLVAMSDATGDPSYAQRAGRWFAVMRERMRLGADDTFQIWNYWEPAGPWDYGPDRRPRHWIGVHPNAGYYAIDVEAISVAYQHKLGFDGADMARLINTALASHRQWPALAAFDLRIRRAVLASLNPTGWAEVSLLPWFLSLRLPD